MAQFSDNLSTTNKEISHAKTYKTNLMVRPKIATKCVLILQECLNRCTTDKSYIKNGFIDIPEVTKAKQKGFTYLLTLFDQTFSKLLVRG